MRYGLIAALLISMPAMADDPEVFKDRAAQESYAIGAQTARTLRKDKMEIDVEMLVRGFRDGLSDEGRLLMSDKEIKVIMSRVQQEVRKNMVMNRRDRGERARQEGAAYLATHAKEPGVQTTESGLQYTVLRAGQGATPAISSTVQVRYTGTLLNGFEFDSTAADAAPARLLVAQTIPGMKEALQRMTVGSHWKLVVPASLGYGERGRDTELGPNEVLLFDIELVGIEPKKD